MQEAYYKLPDDSEFFKIVEISEYEANVLSVSDMGIIIYDTRISSDALNKKFNGLQLKESNEDEFKEQYFKIKNKDL